MFYSLLKVKLSDYLKQNKEFLEQQAVDFTKYSLSEYLVKYYTTLDDFRNQAWEEALANFITPAFDESRHLEMIEKFGYVSIDRHNFNAQNKVYQELKSDDRLDDGTKKFIGFMAGNHFFENNNLDLENWFKSSYWKRPDLTDKYPEYKSPYTINEILDLPNGLNFFKTELLDLNHWRR